MAPPYAEATKRVATDVPESTYKALKQMADDNGRSTASETRFAIDAWLRHHGRKQ